MIENKLMQRAISPNDENSETHNFEEPGRFRRCRAKNAGSHDELADTFDKYLGRKHCFIFRDSMLRGIVQRNTQMTPTATDWKITLILSGMYDVEFQAAT
jgi:hypothetical protein